MENASAIGQLIGACIDDTRMLEHESRAVHGHRRHVLERLIAERGRTVGRLNELGANSRNQGTLLELGRELGRTLRGVIGCSTEGDAISACRRSCNRTGARFDRALERVWSTTTRAMLTEERDRLDAASRALLAVQF